MQVTRQLAALCIQAHQQQTALYHTYTVMTALAAWLGKVDTYTAASVGGPNSRFADSVRQQLQESGLLQHMAAVFRTTADGLTMAAAAVASDAAPSGQGNSHHIHRTVRDYDHVTALRHALNNVERALMIQLAACLTLSPGHPFKEESALRAAPAAMHMIHTTFRTCSELQQLAGREGSPAPVRLLAAGPEFQRECELVFGQAMCFMLQLAAAVHHHDGAHSSSAGRPLQLLPTGGVYELLRCPELFPCLALAVLVAVLGLDTGVQGGTEGTSSNSSGTAGGSSSGEGEASSRGSARRNPSLHVQGSSQQPAAAAAAGTARRHDTSSSSTSGPTSSSDRLANGVSLDSLTPLSHGLFSLLGVNQGVLLQAVRGYRKSPQGGTGVLPDHVYSLIRAFDVVSCHQVSRGHQGCRITVRQARAHRSTRMYLQRVTMVDYATLHPDSESAKQLMSCLATANMLHC